MTNIIKPGWIALAAALALGPALWADEIHEAAKQGNLEKLRPRAVSGGRLLRHE
jgi:hypothetical protein